MGREMEASSDIKLMLMTIGGSPEPIRKSIEKYAPDQIIFLASHDSISLSGQILKDLGFKPEVKFEITENPNQMLECYQKARKCIDRAKRSNLKASEIMVDYTGGTKVMTAALILAAAGNSYRFNYVGGTLRNKDGVGTVVCGHEELFAEMSPWAVFAEEERRQTVALFNARQFAAVIEITRSSDRKLPHQIECYFKFVQCLAKGFLHWDQFDHSAASRYIEKGSSDLQGYLGIYSDSDLSVFLNKVQECKSIVDNIIKKTDGQTKHHRVLIDDIINNARRKKADGLFDDAAARVYRALELYGQIVFQEFAGCSNDKVAPIMVPEKIRDEYKIRYGRPKSKYLKLPLEATFNLLKESGQKEGVRFYERIKEIKNIQSNRNQSILAHGIKPVSERAIVSIFKSITDFIQFENRFDFPALP